MAIEVNCPACFKTIPAINSFEGTYFCECGHQVHVGRPEDEAHSKSSFRLVLLGLLIVAGMIHAVNWDTHSIAIIPLKTKQILGSASLEELKKIADICEARKKFFCQENALSEASRIDQKDEALALQVAKLQMNREAYDAAVKTLSSYFSRGGKERVARLQLAQALWKTGQTKDAAKHLHYLVYSDRRHLDAEAARTYVNLLMSQKNYPAAQKVIQHCRGLGHNASLFMEKEWKEIQTKLGRS